MKVMFVAFLLIISFGLLEAKTYSLDEILELVKSKNLDIKISKFEERIKSLESSLVDTKRYGELDFVQAYTNTNHAGDAFGMKLSSREATFGDFGFGEFLGWMENDMRGDILGVAPKALNHPSSFEMHESKIEYTVPLYTGGLISSYKRIATSLFELSKLESDELLSKSFFEAKKSYFDLLLLQNFKENLDEILEAIERLELSVESMIEEGYAKHIDLLEVQTQKANIKRVLNQSVANQKLLYEYLSFLCDEEIGDIKKENLDIPVLDVSSEDVLENSLEIKKLKIAKDIAKDSKRLEESSFYPKVGAVFRAGYASSEFFDYKERDYYTLGLELRWNIFSGGAKSKKIEMAKIEQLKVDTQEELAKKGLTLSHSRIKTEIKSFDYDISSLKKELELKERIYENYQERYKEKLVSINDVLIKHNERIKTTLELQTLQNSRNKKIFELEKLANRGEM